MIISLKGMSADNFKATYDEKLFGANRKALSQERQKWNIDIPISSLVIVEDKTSENNV